MKKFSKIQPYLYTQHSKDAKYTLTFNKKGDVSVGFKLKLKEIYTLDESELSLINDEFIKAIISLPVGSCVHKQDYFFNKNHKGTNLNRENLLYTEHEKHFYEREFLDHESYIFISFTSTTFQTRSAKNTIFSGGKGNKIKYDKLDEFFIAVEKFEYLIEKSGIGIEKINQSDSTKLKYKYFSLEKNGNVVSDYSFEDNLKTGEKIVSIYSLNNVRQLPKTIEETSIISSTEKSKIKGSFLYPLSFKLGFDHILNTVIHRVDEEKYKEIVKKENKRTRGISVISNYNHNVKESNDNYITMCESDEYNACKMHFNLIAIANKENEIKVKNECESAFDEIGKRPKNNKIRLANLFWGSAPFNASDLPVEVMIPSFVQEAVCYNTWETNYNSAVDGIILYDRLTQRPVVVDLWDKPYIEKIIKSRNCTLFGFSGEGKSVLMNHIFSQYLEQEYSLVILDIGDSYKKICELYGGTYYKYNREEPLFNPFIVDLDNITPGEFDEFIESLTDLIFTAWKRRGDLAAREEESIVKLSLKNYYKYIRKNPSVKQCFDTYYEHYANNCSEDRKLSDDIFNVESYLLVMKEYCTGEMYGNVFNGDKNINVKTDKFIVFELDNIKDNKILFPIVSQVITHTVNNTIFKQVGVKKAIWIDEAWKVLEHNGMAQFLKYLYKTLRKKKGQVGIVVQDITDIPENDIGNTIISQSAIKILMPHRSNASSIPIISNRISLTKHATNLLHNINSNIKEGNYTELLLVLGNESKVYRLELSKYSYYAFSSEEDDNEDIKKHLTETGSMETALTRMVEKNKKP